MPPVLYLLDGHALAYRTYYALTRGGGTDRWTTRSGEPTAGVYGFASVLLRILEQERPDYLMVAFDTGKTFRDDIFADYKGTREKMPDELAMQMVRVRQLVDAFNIPRIELDGYEADDVLGSLAEKAVEEGLGVKIITGDRDLLQLVNDRIIVTLPGKSLSDSNDYLIKDVIENFNVRPDQIVDYKALVGDKSDNIPGVAGVGEKTAASLLQQYETLDNIYANLDKIPESTQKKLQANKDNAYLSQKLARIITNLSVPLDLDRARTDNFDPRNVENLFRELEFRSLVNRLDEFGTTRTTQGAKNSQQLTFLSEPEHPKSIQIEQESPAYKVIQTSEDLTSLVSRLEKADQIAFDTETTSTSQMKAELVGISLAVGENEGYYIPIGHRGSELKQLDWETVRIGLNKSLSDPQIPKVGHNLKYDYVMLYRYGLKVTPLAFDTMVAEWLCNPTSRNLGLKNLVWVRLDIKMTAIEELIGKGRNQISMADVPIEPASAYAAADAVMSMRLIPGLRSELESRGVDRLFHEIEMPLVEVLAGMEITGIALDMGFLADMSRNLNGRLVEIEDKIFAAVGMKFNLNSPQQLSDVLFNQLKLTPPGRTSRTSTGFYSTSADTLEAMRGAHKVVDWVLEYREIAKLKSTYVDALPNEINPNTGRVHTSYNQAGSVTGRIASSEPNLQNIPIRTDLGRQIRKAFIADPGNQLISADYSQVELRIVAHMSEDQAMLEAFWAGQDIHAATAAAIFKVPIDQVTKGMRNRAKSINFGLIYGMSAFGLSRTADLTLAEAEEFMKAYFQQFPRVKEYLDGIKQTAAQQGYVETLLGRRRYFPGLKNLSNASQRGREEREAINAPIQGTAADIMKIAMLRVPSSLSEAGLSGKMLLQVHDELVIECPIEQVRQTAEVICQVMGSAYTLKVPLLTEARSGPNWFDLSPVI